MPSIEQGSRARCVCNTGDSLSFTTQMSWSHASFLWHTQAGLKSKLPTVPHKHQLSVFSHGLNFRPD